jgi:hypothetical protein
MRVERGAGLVESGIRQPIMLGVEVQEPRNQHYPLVHLATLLDPGNVRQQRVEQGIRTAEPAGQQVDPSATAQLVPHDAASQGREGHIGSGVEE